MPDRLLTYAEAADHFRLPVRTLRALVRRHAVPVLDAGRRVMFDPVAIAVLTESLRRCHSPSTDAPKPARIVTPSFPPHHREEASVLHTR